MTVDVNEISVYMMTTPRREQQRNISLNRWLQSDYGDYPRLVVDSSRDPSPKVRQTTTALRLLRHFQERDQNDWLLFLEDDTDPIANIMSVLSNWAPLQGVTEDEEGYLMFAATLYNAGVTYTVSQLPDGIEFAKLGNPKHTFGSQALLLSRNMVDLIIEDWDTYPDNWMQDLRIYASVAAARTPLWVATPSFVQHIGERSTWGGPAHSAGDFRKEFYIDS